MPIYGWDASNHDWVRGPMDLAAAVRDGIQFFTHKATEGVTYRDPYFGQAISRARAAGMDVYGAYMVPRSGFTAAAQVDHFLRYLNEAAPGWRTDPRFRVLQVDTEDWGYDRVPPTLGAQCCDLLRDTGKYVIHYAPAWAYGNSIPGTDPLWASAYGANSAAPYRQAYRGDDAWPAKYSGRTPAIWQFGSAVTIGSQRQCDINAIKDPAVWAAMRKTGGDMPQLDAVDISRVAMAVLLGRTDLGNVWGQPGVNAVARDVAGNTVADVAAGFSARLDALEKKVGTSTPGGTTPVALDQAAEARIIDGVVAKLGPVVVDELAKRLGNG